MALLAALRPAAPADPIERLEETIGYLDGQRAWIGASQAWQEAGSPIGSGLVERAVELVINRRRKRRGRRWWRITAQGVTALRIRRLNGVWEQRTRSDLPLVA